MALRGRLHLNGAQVVGGVCGPSLVRTLRVASGASRFAPGKAFKSSRPDQHSGIWFLHSSLKRKPDQASLLSAYRTSLVHRTGAFGSHLVPAHQNSALTRDVCLSR